MTDSEAESETESENVQPEEIKAAESAAACPLPDTLPFILKFNSSTFFSSRSMRNAGIFVLFCVLSNVCALVFDLYSGGAYWSFPAGLLASVLITVCLVQLFKHQYRPALTVNIALTGKLLTLPRSVTSSQNVNINVEDVLSITKVPPLLRIDCRNLSFAYPLAKIENQSAIQELIERVKRELPEDKLAKFIENVELNERLLLKDPATTKILLVVLLFIYFYELVCGADKDPVAMVMIGANSPYLVKAGEWWRLFSANLLHLNFIHFYLNSYCLFCLGSLVEKLIGRSRFLLIFVLSALAGSLASFYLSGHAFSVGVSTALYGLLFGLAVVQFLHQSTFPTVFRISKNEWTWLVLINGSLPLIVHNIDVWAHVGGAIAGAVTAYFLTGKIKSMSVLPPVPLYQRVITAFVCAAFSGIALFGIFRAQFTGQGNRAEALQSITANETLPAYALNEFARNEVCSRRCTAASLNVAQEAAMRAWESTDRKESGYADTLATIAHRLGNSEEAVKLERLALSGGRAVMLNFYATQLSRFAAESKAFADGGLSTVLKLDGAHGNIEIAKNKFDRLIFAAVYQGGTEVGLLRIFVPSESSLVEKIPVDRFSTESKLVPRLVIAERAQLQSSIKSDERQVRYFPHDKDVDKLP